jgi:hypothetical protein
MTLDAILDAIRAEGATSATLRPPAPSSNKPPGWSDRLNRLVYEPVADRPGCWQETAESAALCI